MLKSLPFLLALVTGCQRSPYEPNLPRTSLKRAAERRIYCEACLRRGAQCGIAIPVNERCAEGRRTIGNPDEMSCKEILDAIDKLGYLW